MADNFNLRSFLTENKLTKNAQLLREQQEDYKYFDEEGVGGFYLGQVKGITIYSLEDSSVMDTCMYALEGPQGVSFIDIDVAGEPISPPEILKQHQLPFEIAQFIADDIDRELGDGLDEMFVPKSDAEYKAELEDYLQNNQIYGYTDMLFDILTSPEEEAVADTLADFLDDHQIYGYNKGLLAIFRDYSNRNHPDNENDLDEELEEGADDKGKMARTHVVYSASVTLGDENGRQYVEHIRASVRKGEDAQQRAAQLIQKHFEDKAENGDPFIDGKFIKINSIGKALNPERTNIKEPQIAENNKQIMKETKLTAKERRLVEMVNNAMGFSEGEENVDYTMGRQDDPNQLPNPAPELNIPEGEESIEEAKPLPKYNSIEELMKEIEHGTNEAAHKYKMEEMKRVYEALEAKVGSLEEGENAEHIDQKKVKQMRKDIAALRKAEEKLRKEFEKKFTGKEKKETPAKEKEVVALQEGSFDLRKFLAENRK